MAIASLVLGILALILTIASSGLFGWLSAVLAIIGIVLGIKGKSTEQRGIATAGIVCSIIALALGLIIWIACVVCVSGIVFIATGI